MSTSRDKKTTPAGLSAAERSKVVALRALGSTLAECAEAVGVTPAALRQYIARGNRGEGDVEFAERMGAAAKQKLTQDDIVRMLESEAREEKGSERRQKARVFLLRLARERAAQRAAQDRPLTPAESLMDELARRRSARNGDAGPSEGALRQEAWQREQRERAERDGSYELKP